MLRLLLPLLLLAARPGGDDPKGPFDGTFLLRGVAVWQADGTLLEDRSLLLRDGLIAEIGGPGLAAPPAARIIAAQEGWTVYPGLIHASFEKGLADPPDSPFPDSATDPKADPAPAMERGSRKDLRGWVHAADLLDWDPKQQAAWRERGFTSAYVVPEEGILRGRAAWVSLNGRPLGEALLQREGLLTLSLRTRGNGYPSTPMAALAVLRQAFLDARRLDRPAAGRHREDPDLSALAEDPGRPLLFEADSAREIENALDLGRDFAGGRRLVVFGGRDADKLTGRLRAAGAAVLLRLDLPEKPKDDKQLKIRPADERPWWQEPERLREERRAEHARLVTRYLRLREAGVDCAAFPGFSPRKMKPNLEQWVEAGLGPGAILQAFSADVARILGLQDVGAVEPGRAADLFISRGPWNPAEPDLAWVFADGRGWELPAREEEDEAEKEESEADGAPEDLEAARAALDGLWVFEVDSPRGTQEFRVRVDTASGSAVLTSERTPDEQKVDLEWEDDAFWFRFTPPGTDFSMRFRAEVSGEDAEGEVILPEGMGRFEAPGHREEKPETAMARAASLRSGRASGQEPAPEGAATESEAPPQDEEKSEAGQDEDALPAGHPPYPVETREDRRPDPALEGDVLLRGATLYTLTGDEPFTGDLLIQDGRIAGIGARIQTLQAVPELDASGWHVMPGIIDPHSHLALDAVNEGTQAITAECRIADMIRPGSPAIYRAAAGGTALNQTLHGSANPIGGQAALWELDVNRASIAELLLPGAPPGIKFALGENVKQSNWSSSGSRFPASRSGVEAVYRRALARAQEYSRARAEHRAGRDPGFRRDVRLEVLADVLEGRIHVQCHSYRADELLMFLGICEDFGIERPTFQHVLEGYKVAPELAAHGAMASTFSDWWAYKIEAYDAIPWNPWLMSLAGVVATINSDSGEMIRRLNTEAGKSLLYGHMEYEDAMALCTRNAAIQLRVEDRLGTLETGKEGTISAFDAPPLSTHARCMLTLARGRTLFAHQDIHDSMWQEYASAVAAFAAAHAPADPPQRRPRERSRQDWQRWIQRGQGLAYLIAGARVHPVSGEPFDGAVLVRDGVIERIWRGAPPAAEDAEGADVTPVDASGLHLYPGFIDAGDQTGLYEIGSVRGTIDSAETGSVQPDLSLASAVHGESSHFAVQRMTGITTVLVRGTQGLVPGKAALVHLDGEVNPDFVAVPDLALQVRFPRVERPKPGKQPEDPETLEELDRWFDDALDYGERRDRCIQAGAPLPERNLKLEALLPYARGEETVLLEAGDWYTLARALRWSRARGLDAVFVAGNDAWKVAGLLGMEAARVITGPVHSLPRGANEPYDGPYRNAGVLAAAGCEVALQTDNPEVTRNLPFQAATAAAHGWSEPEALRALTLGAAKVLGVEDFAGSIEEGKVADLFLCTGDPLDFQSEVRRLWIGGREVELRSRQTGLRDKYLARIRRMRAPSR